MNNYNIRKIYSYNKRSLAIEPKVWKQLMKLKKLNGDKNVSITIERLINGAKNEKI